MRAAIWVAVQRRATSYSKGPAKHVDPARTDLNHSARAANAVGVTASAEVGLKPPGARSDEGSLAINPGDKGSLTVTRGQPAGIRIPAEPSSSPSSFALLARDVGVTAAAWDQ